MRCATYAIIKVMMLDKSIWKRYDASLARALVCSKAGLAVESLSCAIYMTIYILYIYIYDARYYCGVAATENGAVAGRVVQK